MNRFTKLSSTSIDLPDEAPDWAMVRDNNLYLINGEYRHLVWPRSETTERHGHADAVTAAAALTLGGHTDWALPEDWQLQTIVDRSRVDPSVNTDFFDTNGSWCWSATKHASYAGFAWLADSYDGYVGYSHRDVSGFVRAVRSVPPSQ